MFSDSIDTLISLIQPNLAKIWASACKHMACMHTSLRTWVKLCAQRGTACSPDSIYTWISLIRPNLAEIWACARKKIVCIQACLCDQVDLRAQKDPACYPHSIDTLISLIRTNLAEIWACANKHIGSCTLASALGATYVLRKVWHVILIP